MSTILIIGIAVPVIGGNTNTDDEITGEVPNPVPHTVPILMKEPFMSDVQTVEFKIAGCANVAVDAEVEVGSTDFLPGSSNVGVFTTAEDNYATGAFRVHCAGLVEGTLYYYRLKLTNGADSIYYPNATATSGPHNIGVTSPPGDCVCSLAQVQDRPTNTNQAQFLCIAVANNCWPYSLITTTDGIAAWGGMDWRNSTTGECQFLPNNYRYFGAWGMWDDGAGMAFWHNETEDGVYVGIPAPFAAVKTDKFIPQKTATATGPVGTGGADVTITYDHIGYSSESEPNQLLPEPSPEPSTVPMIKVDPFMADVTTVAFWIVGVCDIAVDVEVEVGSVDFLPGTGNVGVFTTTLDNYASGVFKVSCTGLSEGTQYYWRVSMTNGADMVYYPSATTTEGPVNIGTGGPFFSPNVIAQVQDRPTNTNQANFLCTVAVEMSSGGMTHPLSLITDGAGIVAFTPAFRDTNGQGYLPGPSDPYHLGAWGMWDDGTGMDFWYNNTNSGIYIGNPAPFAAVKTDKEPPPPPDEIELYYSTDSGANWQLAGNDTNVNGSYPWICPGPGTYHWIANSVGGNDDVGIPAPGTLPEAGPYINGVIFDIPLIEGWNLISLPLVQTNESIDQVLNSIAGKWDCIQVYDPLSPEPWKSNNVYRPDQLDDFNTLNHIQGFWINITEPGGTTLSAFGWDLASTSIPLYAGWNLVGYPTLNYTTTVAEALFGTGADHVEVFDPAEPYRIKEVPPTYIMQPGEGYWVHVPIDTIWTIDW